MSFTVTQVPLFWISGDVSSRFRFFCRGECNVDQHSLRSRSGATYADL